MRRQTGADRRQNLDRYMRLRRRRSLTDWSKLGGSRTVVRWAVRIRACCPLRSRLRR
jgi:hypothetical protein